MMTLDRHVIGALVRHNNLPPGALGKPFYEIPPDSNYVQQVAQWHHGLPQDQRVSADTLKVLSAPDLVADVRSLTGNDSLMRTWALARQDCNPGPIVLLASTGEGAKQLKVQRVASREVFADTLLLWLVAAGEPSEPEMKVEMTQNEFAVLLAFIDLRSRAKYSAFLSHRAVEKTFAHSFVIQAYDEAVKLNDPRWLLSFALPQLDEAAATVDPQAIWQGIQGLAQRRLVEASGNEWRFTVPGEYLAESLHRRTVSVGIDTAAADPDSSLGTHAAMLIRCDDPLWFFDIPAGGNVTVAGISVQGARQVLDSILTPIGKAPAARMATPATAAPPRANGPAQPAFGAPPPASPPPTTRPQAATAPLHGAHGAPPALAVPRCPTCGQAVAPGAMFCGTCGGRLR